MHVKNHSRQLRKKLNYKGFQCEWVCSCRQECLSFKIRISLFQCILCHKNTTTVKNENKEKVFRRILGQPKKASVPLLVTESRSKCNHCLDLNLINSILKIQTLQLSCGIFYRCRKIPKAKNSCMEGSTYLL